MAEGGEGEADDVSFLRTVSDIFFTQKTAMVMQHELMHDFFHYGQFLGRHGMSFVHWNWRTCVPLS